MVLIFIVAKVVFFMACADGGVSISDLPGVLSHGISLDLSTSLYFVIVPYLLTMASVWLSVPACLYRIYHLTAAVVLALAFVADTSLYPFWGFKLDASCLQYLDTPTEAAASVTTGFLAVRLLLVVLVAAAVFAVENRVGRLLPVSSSLDQRELSDSPSDDRLPSVRARLKETLYYILLIPLIVIGIRGGLDESTTNIGQAYYSQHQFLNHAAVNPVFSFVASLEKTANDVPDYHFMDDDECEQLVSRYYPTQSVGVDTLLRTRRPDVVVILLESCGGIFTRLEGPSEVMPRLNQLMDEGVSFDSCYANSWRTDRGTVCAYSGYPSFPVSSVMKMPAKTRLLPGLAQSLHREGYATHYLYGGDINFTNMRSYLVGTGFSQLTWKKDYSPEEQATAEWGVRDDITFATLASLLLAGDSTRQRQPRFIGFSTLSSHEPWDVPVSRFSDPTLNAFYYLDQCIGQLVDTLRQSAAWDNLLLVLLPDHGVNYHDVNYHDRRRNHIPMVWTGGAVSKPRHIMTICNQTDLPATLLGQLGISHDDYRYSRDVMSSSYREPFAVNTFNNGISMIDSTGFAIYDLNVGQTVVDESTDADQLILKGKAVLQSACKNLKTLHP